MIGEGNHILRQRTTVGDPIPVVCHLNNNEGHFRIIGESGGSYLATAVLENVPEHSLADLIKGGLRDFWAFFFVVHFR